MHHFSMQVMYNISSFNGQLNIFMLCFHATVCFNYEEGLIFRCSGLQLNLKNITTQNSIFILSKNKLMSKVTGNLFSCSQELTSYFSITRRLRKSTINPTSTSPASSSATPATTTTITTTTNTQQQQQQQQQQHCKQRRRPSPRRCRQHCIRQRNR